MTFKFSIVSIKLQHKYTEKNVPLWVLILNIKFLIKLDYNFITLHFKNVYLIVLLI